jgi:hypothetical protein
MRSVRGWTGLVVTLCASLALIDPAGAQTDTSVGDQWKQTDRTMSDLVGEGYELVSVAQSSQAHTYFLRKPGKMAKCSETAALEGLPPAPPVPGTLIKGQAYGVTTPGELPRTRIDTECAELVRPQTQ